MVSRTARRWRVIRTPALRTRLVAMLRGLFDFVLTIADIGSLYRMIPDYASVIPVILQLVTRFLCHRVFGGWSVAGPEREWGRLTQRGVSAGYYSTHWRDFCSGEPLYLLCSSQREVPGRGYHPGQPQF